MDKLITLIAGLGIAATALPAAAAPAGNRYAPSYGAGSAQVDFAQHEIKNNIASGVKTGALTRREASRMQAQFAEIEVLEARYRRSGGRLEIAESRELLGRLDALQQVLRKQKNDAQARGAGRNGWRA